MAPAAAILGCVDDLPFLVGAPGLAKILIGSLAAAARPDRTRFHGVLRGLTASAVESVVARLVAEGYLDRVPVPRRDGSGDYMALAVTALGRDGPPAWEGIVVAPRRDAAPRFATSSDGARGNGGAKNTLDGPLDAEAADRFERLRAWCIQTAQREQKAPFMVLPTSTLRAIAALDPTTVNLDSLARLPGIGPVKLQQYGAAVLELINSD